MLVEGTITALVTPMHESGIDLQGLKDNVERQIVAGVNGVLVLGSTGESPTLSQEEREAAIRVTVSAAKGRIPVMVGTGGNCTASSITHTCRAAELGADAALIVTPYYNRPTQEGIFRHFAAIEAASSLPLCVYNHPGRTGQDIEVEVLQRICALPGVVGVKEASACLDRFQDLVAALDVPVLSGNDSLTLPSMVLGGRGVVSVASNLLPELMHQMVEAALSGDYMSAQRLHGDLRPLFAGLCIESNPIPIKAAMKMWGMAAGSCRLPLCDLSPRNHARLCAVLEQFPLSQSRQQMFNR